MFHNLCHCRLLVCPQCFGFQSAITSQPPLAPFPKDRTMVNLCPAWTIISGGVRIQHCHTIEAGNMRFMIFVAVLENRSVGLLLFPKVSSSKLCCCSRWCAWGYCQCRGGLHCGWPIRCVKHWYYMYSMWYATTYYTGRVRAHEGQPWTQTQKAQARANHKGSATRTITTVTTANTKSNTTC